MSSTRYPRLVEAAGVLFLLFGLVVWLSLLSYHPEDPSLNTAAAGGRARNLIGPTGSYAADLMMQAFGLLAFLLPVALLIVAWKWVRARPLSAPIAKLLGWTLFLMAGCAGLELGPRWRLYDGAITTGGITGRVLAEMLLEGFNLTGAAIAVCAVIVVSLYLSTGFELGHLAAVASVPSVLARPVVRRWQSWRELRRERKMAEAASAPEPEPEQPKRRKRREQPQAFESTADGLAPEPGACPAPIPVTALDDPPPFDLDPEPEAAQGYIPIRTLEELPRDPSSDLPQDEPRATGPRLLAKGVEPPRGYERPSTTLLNEAPARSGFDQDELRQRAVHIEAKLKEFNVLGSVVQINPGPVVTTFEFKPEAGIKYNRITALTEDLCLGLEAESIIIERIPGKPTVGIEVPNTRREVISLRQILESEEFGNSASHLSIPLGKDVNGRIKVTTLESMPHLLIAGSTGSGKSVMLNSLITSILYKSTPDEVRMILVDPKRVEMGLYEGIPHLLTPVITDAKKATNALSNAVLEMERRLRLLASQSVRNIEQYNKKIAGLQTQPISLFEGEEPPEDLQPLAYILIVIDELADLMMLEGRNVEASVTRLAQMARAVGMHLVLATQRPSVDVITGLIKANFPARLSFRVATRVDSRTVLDVMGAEHLLGKGDMLFLPPGSSRLVRVHGAFITEAEIGRVVDFWKGQARPDYDQSYLIAPPEDDGAERSEDEGPGDHDPLYDDAVRVVLEMGKASTSTLQRRLRLGYGRAARILDDMQREGIIGPPDGSKAREVLRRPDWLDRDPEE
ncbi:MAG TPA: DNA translocase FtsK [Bryobacteraceae bacterium]|nr:DNA translocase FtsK [Bryobacteraceae bacterium]